jgi:hypothetical protein
MNARLIVMAGMLLPLTLLADETSTGEEIFDRKCSQCHTFAMARAMLEPKPEQERPEYLRVFLETHPAKLDAAEKAIVIEALSRRAD